ncbi:P-loop containing nucleoside triphosphate hydrolase protein [Trichodelitschia bisporula]|uniref:Ribosome assembly protein 1 n=1 Tax=Trichodelitschia bisporula TaxID=703511 RepID=A0A6G1HR74_9PEZI|nr:P-loop containing nucleoside triphosphate hydrolase protein [Trichodelitschia bisporula]
MPVVNPEKLIALQKSADNVRNICILAHVDHGKTSLTDALIATNGIISPKLAGKIRYLDSRPDEQLRGITMESSAISLFFSIGRRPSPDAPPQTEEYLINLIDSPGHIDFSSEVSTASRLCDGAVVLVDAVEGVCSQTVTVLRQVWIEKLKPLLVINKMDRLVTELKLTPAEAYTHLSKLLEQVNAVMGSFFQGERMEEDLKWREKLEERVAAASTRQQERDTTGNDDSIDTDEFQERDDEDIYFAPEKNNVIFSSAVDGWAFTVKQFATLYEKKLGIKRTVLEKVLWGDFYLDPKTKRVLGAKHLKGRALKPMFVQLVLANVWAVYEATAGGDHGKGDPAMVEKITKSLNLSVPAHILRSRDPRALLTALFAAWLPLSTATLISVIEQLPSPRAAQAARIPEIVASSPGAEHVDPRICDAMAGFSTDPSAPVVAYVSKMVAVPASELPENKRRGTTLSAEEARELARRKRAEFARAQAAEAGGIADALSTMGLDDSEKPEPEPEPEKEEEPDYLIGFARLFSGTLNVGDEIFVLPPKFSPAHPHAKPAPTRVTVTALYLLMGRSLEALKSVPAGVVFGIGGLAGHVLKAGTLCSAIEGGVNLAGVSVATAPIVRVALEPEHPADLDKMIQGLKLLEQADPCAVYEVLESGEHVLATAGELHLERCLKDLRERFARCEIAAGEPIVPYRESIVAASEMNPPREKDLPRGTVVAETSSKQVAIRLRVRPLPAPVTEFLVRNAGVVKRLHTERRAREERGRAERTGEAEGEDEADRVGEVELLETAALSLDDFKTQLASAFASAKEKDVWTGVVERIVAFGPRRVGPNVLIGATGEGLFEPILTDTHPEPPAPSATLTPRDLRDKIAHAFQLSTQQGPLCHEPLQGVAVFIESVDVRLPPDDAGRDKLGRLTGEVLRAVREGVRVGFLDWSPRMMLAMYSCEIQAAAEVLGRVYGVITRRRGHILSEQLNEGTPFFSILALLPVAESFGFAAEMRTRTSGNASPQLVFQGYEMLDEDPFWVPTTEEEMEDLGELADRENVAKKYMDRVRERKGLFVGRKLVESAEKQKTLKR